jgi:NTE family protein
MKKKEAWVLGGGGSRGALQVGAVEALLEAGRKPEMLLGTSIGAVNATFLAVHGQSPQGLEKLKEVWRQASHEQLMPANYLWLTVRSLFNKPASFSVHRLREFLISSGITPDLTFNDVRDVALYLVAADLNNHCLEIYGHNPEQSLLEGVLASSALPPWATLMEVEGRLLIDGGALSNLPIEPALSLGAREIIALNLTDERDVPSGFHFGPFVWKLITSIHHRQVELELALAESRGVLVRHVRLQGKDPVAIWDFHETERLMLEGYKLTRAQMDGWEPPHRPGLLERLIGMPGWRARA